jgi:hypothetical protein
MISFRLSLALVALVAVGCSSSSTASTSGDGADAGGTVGDQPLTNAKPTDCSAAREGLLTPVDAVSTGAVTVLATEGDVKRLYIDASAGGFSATTPSPRVYINLATGARVDVTDKTAIESLEWDLSFKRAVIYTNGGSGGSGKGASLFVEGKAIGAVSAADGQGGTFVAEEFFNADCDASLDLIGSVRTSLSSWYDYDQSTSYVSARAGTFLVKGAKGDLYKVQMKEYYANPDGTTGKTSGRFIVEVAPAK